jgi:hypothetical protein
MRGILEISQQLPVDTRTWEQFTRKLNQAIKVSGDQAYITALITLADRAGVSLSELLELIGDDGRMTDQSFLRMITFANAGSVQSTIPLSASADAVVATINVAPHDVIFGGETISYAAGVVLGAPVNTDLHIYADDPDLEGGAVTYEFTTDYTDLAGSKDRYRVGAIRTPVSSISAAISAATNTNPVSVTTGVFHGLNTGDSVTHSGVGGMTELNALPAKVITVTSPTSYTLNGVDGTAFGVYTSGGTVTRVSVPAAGIGGAGGSYEIYYPGYFY